MTEKPENSRQTKRTWSAPTLIAYGPIADNNEKRTALGGPSA
jgi:hypothetical protein